VEERVDVEPVLADPEPELASDRTIADEPLPVEEPTFEEPIQYELGVTPSADWDLDEDPASYSAPI
jgi:hypothetical protein